MRSSTRRSLARLAAAAAALTVVACAGCAGGETSGVIARVGDRAITVADYNDAARGAMFRYPGPPDSAKLRLVEDLVRQKLLLEYGYRSGVLVDSMVRRDRRTMEDQLLRAAIIGRLVPASVAVSEAETRRFWEWREKASHVQLIYTPNREMADAALTAVTHGEDFGAVANRFNLAGLVPPQGDLGYVSAGALADPLDRMVRETPTGQVVGPVRAPGEGWFLLKVLDRQPSQRDSFHIEAPQLEDALQQRKRRLLSAHAFEAIREQYRVKLEPDAVPTLYEHMQNRTSPEGVDLPLTPQERSKVLARYDGGFGHSGGYTLGDAMHDLETVQERPTPAMMSSFGPFIESRVVERVLLIEARRRRLDQDPTITKAFDRRFEMELLNSVFNMAIAQRVAPTEEDARMAYERDRTPTDPPFEALDPARKQSLMYAGAEVAQLRRLNALSDSLRAAVPVRIDTAAIRRLPWPVLGAS